MRQASAHSLSDSGPTPGSRLRPGLLATGLAVALGLGVGSAWGQDVEMLGQRYGTRPPAAYYDRIAAEPGAFRFSSAWTPRLRNVLQLREPGEGDGGEEEGLSGFLPGPSRAVEGGSLESSSAAGFLARGAAVEGTFRFPLIMGLFADSPPTPPFDLSAVRAQFVDGPNPSGTIPDYYREVSGGRVELLPEVTDWERTSLTAEDVTGGSSGLGSGARVGDFISRILTDLEAGSSIDWGRYDNDGPDGVPNSGDDDGFVDVLAVIHPTRGAECGGADNDDRIWSHRWSLASAHQVFVTNSVSNSDATRDPGTGLPGRIRVNDYTIQPVRSCNDVDINEIGVFAHELGHGFGLPDLYAVGGSHGAVGEWGLMGTGSWGCQGSDPGTPCHLGAWSKAVLGWVDVVSVTPGASLEGLTLDPVEDGGSVLRIDALDGSGEYFLLENRQGLGFDRDLHAEGLLVWQVSTPVLDEKWPYNRINTDPTRMGVRVRQADGLEELSSTGGGRGDAGDIYPGSSNNPVFHAGSVPASWTLDGNPSGLTLLGIEQVGLQMRFDLIHRYQQIGIQIQGATPQEALVELDGEELLPGGGGELGFASAPFQAHRLEARGRGDSELAGVRLGFEGWQDTPDRARDWVTGLSDATLVATFSGEEVKLFAEVESDYPGPVPGTVSADPEGSGDLWFLRGAEITLSAAPTTGFQFLGWGGDLAGAPNPTTVVMDDPVRTVAGFQLIYAIEGLEETVGMQATVPQEVTFEVVNATEPVTWAVLPSGGLPEGLSFEPQGEIVGTPMETGDFVVTVRALDGRGLRSEHLLTLQVSEPAIGAEALTGPLLGATGALTEVQTDYLDRSGNDNGVYDLGDFRSFLVRNPGLPMSADLQSLVRTLIQLPPAWDPGPTPDRGPGSGGAAAPVREGGGR
jgi:M6 family metalloprotease-like protein